MVRMRSRVRIPSSAPVESLDMQFVCEAFFLCHSFDSHVESGIFFATSFTFLFSKLRDGEQRSLLLEDSLPKGVEGICLRGLILDLFAAINS